MTRLLIVDDNQENLYMLQVLMSANGFQVELASNGAEALERARCAPPDLIISDILMPVMDGFALCRAWKEDGRLKDIPFVFYTATYTDPKDEDFALSLGAERFIVKPIEPDKFLAQLLETIQTHKAGQLAAPCQPTEEAIYYKEYNAVLIRKLEDKMLQLAEANRILERDITGRKQAEEALRVRTAELEHLTETLDRRVQERTTELARANEALHHLSSKLLSAQEEERKKIAGEIHDAFGACLAGIKYKVDTVLLQIGKNKTAAAESLKTLIPVIQEGVEECRRMQMELRPSMLDDLGLLPTLSWFCRQFQTIYPGIRIEQEIEIQEDDVPHPLKIVAFRVIQEAMNNIAKHSQANLARLSLRKLYGRVELGLQDNGRGFNLEKMRSLETTKRGMGLTSMRERIELSGGSFAIESTEGKGTVIRASWPLHQNS